MTTTATGNRSALRSVGHLVGALVLATAAACGAMLVMEPPPAVAVDPPPPTCTVESTQPVPQVVLVVDLRDVDLSGSGTAGALPAKVTNATTLAAKLAQAVGTQNLRVYFLYGDTEPADAFKTKVNQNSGSATIAWATDAAKIKDSEQARSKEAVLGLVYGTELTPFSTFAAGYETVTPQSTPSLQSLGLPSALDTSFEDPDVNALKSKVGNAYASDLQKNSPASWTPQDSVSVKNSSRNEDGANHVLEVTKVAGTEAKSTDASATGATNPNGPYTGSIDLWYPGGKVRCTGASTLIFPLTVTVTSPANNEFLAFSMTAESGATTNFSAADPAATGVAGGNATTTTSTPPTPATPIDNGSTRGGKSTPLIAGGGIAGLLVGAGAGAALMAKRRKVEDDGPNGSPMSPMQPPPGPLGQPQSTMPLGPTGGSSPDLPLGATVAAADGAMASGAAAPGAMPLPTGDHDWTVAAPGGGTVRLEDIGVTRIMPAATEHGRTWAVGSSAYAATAGWLEKRKGKGEDAEPTVRVHSSGRGLIGVYDGTGGAGAAIARTTGEGTELSAAFVAARLVRDVVEAWFVDCVDGGDRALATDGLAATLQRVLKEEAQYLPASGSNVRGSLHRVLPTTAACVAFDASDPSGAVDALWAGDSRCFMLTSTNGLQVLSKDDTREADALALIRNDQPMENLVAADRPFRVNHRRFTSDQPMVLLTATDGAFGYVRTPAHFEHLLLHALVTASTLDDWSARLLAAFAEFAADDVSFAMVSLGYASFGELQRAMRPRAEYLAREHWKPFVDNAGNAEMIERLREQSWGTYRDLYQARLERSDAVVRTQARPEVP